MNSMYHLFSVYIRVIHHVFSCLSFKAADQQQMDLEVRLVNILAYY